MPPAIFAGQDLDSGSAVNTVIRIVAVLNGGYLVHRASRSPGLSFAEHGRVHMLATGYVAQRSDCGWSPRGQPLPRHSMSMRCFT